MSKGEYQAIYANVNGWGIQQASSDLPADAAKSFTDYSTMLNRSFSQYRDRYQGTIGILICDGKYVFRMRAVNDSSSDLSGRNTVSTHGFIRRLSDFPALYQENAKLVSFSEANFSGQLRQEPAVYDEPLPDIAGALSHCGLSAETLEKLLRCIYALLLSGSDDTLHIRVPDQSYIQPCMMCIYQALPYSIRPRVSCSNVPVADGAVTVTFLIPDFPQINQNPRFFDLLTGEENVLDADTEYELDKHIAFHHYICMCARYSSELRRLLESLQLQENALHIPQNAGISVRLDLLQLIYQMQLFEMRDSSLTEKDILLLLMRLLNLQLESEYTERTLIHLLQYCDKTQVTLNERVLASMQKKYSQTKNEEVRETIFAFNSKQLLLLGKNDLCKKLSTVYQEDPVLFQRTVQSLREYDNSPEQEITSEALDLLFADYIGRKAPPQDMAQLRRFCDAVGNTGFAPHPFTDAFIREQLPHIAGNYAETHSTARRDFEPFWNSFQNLLCELIPDANERAETHEFAKEAYWRAFRIQTFAEADTDFYRSLAADPDRSPNWKYVRSILDLFRMTPDQMRLRSYSQSASGIVKQLENADDREHMIGALIAHASRIYTKPDDPDGWILFLSEMTTLSQQITNFYSYVFRYEIRQLCDHAEEVYMHSSADKTEFAEYQRLAREYAEQGGKNASLAAETADALKRVSRKKFGLFRKK
ncbi:MAG: hypothetical protein IKQ91_00315 [Oscillospiraceae bacterium]|nr:hypothetical protein [Oscillospiraceae bacterium]